MILSLGSSVARAEVAYPGPSALPPAYGPAPASVPPYPTQPTQPYWPPPSTQPSYYAPYPQTLPPPYGPPPSDGLRAMPEPRAHRFTATISVVHPLLASIFDVTGEFKAGKRGAIAVIAGFGSVPLRMLDKALPDEQAKVYAGGVQLRVYPIGSFEHGLVLGLDTVYLQGSGSGSVTKADETTPTPSAVVTAKGSGFKIGPFAGYKLVLPVGLSFDAAIGIEYLSVKALAKDASGMSASTSLKMPLVLLNGGVGWSF